ncbi:RhoGAP domain-containing protein [Heterostelium album PN500]|uniref:RhoGAP domain-containing protein n=1 Tax=Heterostelium pallidum (strain ATCC 26659 / Pp 5 / PN500) TaxID=670386 RepID=D3AYP9_HETP5|nr:RhoGAP domain-containing protein [Heterostelium album PN500]EFA86076.1 RhoGAP domain-containing protein [Heterostelium album PN500]|eukprot:XP_020438182.1 RhoGAP domain-containing protein [Heterostelium album PN500]
MSNIKSFNGVNNTSTNSSNNNNNNNSKLPTTTSQINYLKSQHLTSTHHQRSTSSPPISTPAPLQPPPLLPIGVVNNNNNSNNNSNNNNNNVNASTSGSTTPSTTPTSPLSPINSITNFASNNPLKSSYEQLRDTLVDYEFDGEVIIKDVSEEDVLFGEEDTESYDESYEDDEDEGNGVVPDDSSSTNSSIIEEEEEELKSPSTGRAYSYTIASAKPEVELSNSPSNNNNNSGSAINRSSIILSRHERSESTIIHPDIKPPTININTVGSASGSGAQVVARVTSTGSLKSPSKQKDSSNATGSLKSNEKATQFKETISSEYKKMLDNPEEFRAQKLKQRKSKFFTKEDIANFHPSSGTQMKSKFYKQFIEEKLSAIHDNVEKYKSDLIKNYSIELTTTRSSGPISFNNLTVKPAAQLKPKEVTKDRKIQRNRSYSQPIDMSTAPKTPMGMTLEAVISRENNRDATNRKIPLLVTKCIDFLWVDKALDTEGLFRVGGNQSEVETLMKSLLQHGFDIPADCCVHVVSSTLKKFLRQLSVPVFTFKYHNDFIKTQKLNDNEKSGAIKQLVLGLPEYNQCLIKELMRFLVDVTKHSSSNMMHAHNLGLMFGPSLMKSPEENVLSIMLDSSSQVITHILENYNQIFD